MTHIINLEEIAKRSLRSNIRSKTGQNFLVAGANQFQTLWVRDFCFSVPALILIGESNLAEQVLDHICLFKDKEGFLPRGLDFIDPKIRVVCATFGISQAILPKSLRGSIKSFGNFIGSKKLRPEWTGEHGTNAFDSNVLVALSYLQLNIPEKALPLLEVYNKHLTNGLLRQDGYSDWQDSAKRTGVRLYLNCLAWKAGLSIDIERFYKC